MPYDEEESEEYCSECGRPWEDCFCNEGDEDDPEEE